MIFLDKIWCNVKVYLPIHVASDFPILIILSDALSCGSNIAEYDMLIPTWITIK